MAEKPESRLAHGIYAFIVENKQNIYTTRKRDRIRERVCVCERGEKFNFVPNVNKAFGPSIPLTGYINGFLLACVCVPFCIRKRRRVGGLKRVFAWLLMVCMRMGPPYTSSRAHYFYHLSCIKPKLFPRS